MPVGSDVAPTMLQRVEELKLLGHWISADTRCVSSAKSAVRAATYRGMRVLRDARVPFHAKWRFLESCVFPMLAYRGSTWAPMPHVMEVVNRMHRWAVAQAAGTRPWPAEAADPAGRPVGPEAGRAGPEALR